MHPFWQLITEVYELFLLQQLKRNKCRVTIMATWSLRNSPDVANSLTYCETRYVSLQIQLLHISFIILYLHFLLQNSDKDNGWLQYGLAVSPENGFVCKICDLKDVIQKTKKITDERTKRRLIRWSAANLKLK